MNRIKDSIMKELRYEYLENLLPFSFEEMEERYYEIYIKEAMFVGPQMYEWRGLFSSDTRELFLMGVLLREGIKFEYD